MEANYDDIILLERYLENSLSAEEAGAVEKRIADEPEFAELYQNELLLVRGIRLSHLKTKLEELKVIEGDMSSTSRPAGRVLSIQTFWRPLAIAAGLTLLAVAYSLWNNSSNPQELFAANFKPYPNVFEPVVRGTGEQNKRAEAFAAYEKGEYKVAAEGFKQLLQVNEEPGVLLLLGNANLMLDRTSEAKENFVTLSKDFDELDLLAKWYLSLCYLKMGETDSARVLLDEIVGQGGSYSEKAKELLNKLD